MCAMGFFSKLIESINLFFHFIHSRGWSLSICQPTNTQKERQTLHFYFLLWFFSFEKKRFKLFYFSTEQKHIYEDGYTKSILYWWCFYWFDNKTNTFHNHTRSMLIRLISLFFHLRLYVFLFFSARCLLFFSFFRGTRKYSHTGFGPREKLFPFHIWTWNCYEFMNIHHSRFFLLLLHSFIVSPSHRRRRLLFFR